ncbi:MAG: S-layer homology domain-containing protein, partial [Candidatus Peregrinibacteria bacterium]
MRRIPLLLASLLFVPITALAIPPVLLTTFKLHDFDKMILSTLGYESGTIVFYKEIASLTTQQSDAIRKHEPVGCFPFYVIRNGTTEESGFNCRSFFCVGYTNGPKVCKNREKEPYGGVVEIGGRLSIIPQDTRKLFSDYLPADRSPYMVKRLVELGAVRCRPFYLLRFDVAVGEGYDCDEMGQYPYYSGSYNCLDDWRKKNDFVCSIAVRDDELDVRKQILQRRGEYVASTGALVPTPVSFPDVIQGYYGYTAITELARRGIISGYPDGTFKPSKNLNRAELSKILISALRPQEVRSESFCFPDVKDEWFAPYVCAAKRLGWLSG